MLTSLIHFVAKVLVIPTAFLFSLAGYTLPESLPAVPTVQQAAPLAGSFNPTGGGTYYLASTVSSSQTTLTLSSFEEPVSNIPYTMTYLNSSIEYGTIAPQTTQSEFISFTGITQNSDGSATLTGVSRGLGRSYPYTASTTLAQPHAGQSRFILSNPPQLTNQYGALANPNSWTAVNTFLSTQKPTYDTNPTFSGADGNAFVNYTTLLNTAIAGAGTSTESNLGIVQLATQTQLQSGTASSTTGAPLVIPNRLSTSTCITGSGGYNLVSSSTSNKLDANCLGTNGNNAWTGTNSFTASTTFSSATTTLNATTTISANTAHGLILNNIPYYFPSAQGASSTVLETDGNGHLLWTQPPGDTILFQDGTAYTASNTSTSSLKTYTISANTLSTTALVKFNLFYNFSGGGGTGAACASISIGTGSASTTLDGGCVGSSAGWLQGQIQNLGSVSSQVYSSFAFNSGSALFTDTTGSGQKINGGTMSLNTGSKFYISINSQSATVSGTVNTTLQGFTLEVVQ